MPPPSNKNILQDAAVFDGTVRSVVFRNEDNGYTVLHCNPPPDPTRYRFHSAKEKIVTVTGKTSAVWPGEEIRATGRWVDDPQHGRQFKADSISCVPPKSVEGIRRYLASGLIKGIGSVNAKRIVDRFGADTLEVLDKYTSRIMEIKGIGRGTLEKIRKAWRDSREMREIMIFTQTYGISVAQTAKIHKRYGCDTIAVIKADPYRLCREIRGIGFATADRIALSVGLPKDSILRARAAISHTLETEAEDSGHCYTPVPDLLLHAHELTEIPVETLADALEKEKAEGRVTETDGNVYLRSIENCEVRVAKKLKAVLAAPQTFRPIDSTPAVRWAEKKTGFTLAPAQVAALERTLRSKVSIITGGPGVGKTTIIRALTDIYRARKLNIFLAAPTGRAAKRLEESTSCKAHTLHRMLKFNPQTNSFTYNEEKHLSGDVFIFDEFSMVDIRLMDDLLAAIPPGATLVFTGDTDQLPSVGPGNVFRDMIASGAIPVSRLNDIFRQDSTGLIVRNAHRVNEGLPFELRSGDTDFYFKAIEDPAQALAFALDYAAERIPRRFNLNPMRDVQILTPMRRNILGAENLNAAMQKRLNPSGVSISRGDTIFRTGDRVMQLRNNYDKDVYNGDIGFIKEVNPENRSLVVDFDGGESKYSSGELDELSLAYATTIHKSQGSEYPAVIVLMHNQHYMMLQRNLLYTAITRGKTLVIVVGTKYAVSKAIETNTVQSRRTTLADRLRQ